jgi:hypothetical protein
MEDKSTHRHKLVLHLRSGRAIDRGINAHLNRVDVVGRCTIRRHM